MTEHQEAPKPKILIVEDEAINSLDLKSHLEQMGYTVLAHVNSAEKALELVEKDPPDLVLLDIILKGKMDGIEAADIIRSRWDIPVVFCTAYADQERLKRAKLVYPFGYIIKPYQDNDLKVTVEMALYVSKVDRERRKIEEALRAERQRLHGVLETMPVMICLLTTDYHVAFANRAFRDKFGESHGRRCYEYCFGKKEPCDFCETYRVLKTAKPHHWQVTTPDGATVIDVYDFPFTDVDGSPMILEVDIDITERKIAEEELRKAHREWENIFQAIGHPALILSPQHDIMAVNRAAIYATGMTEQALVEKKCYEVFHGKNNVSPPSGCPLEKLVNSGQLETNEMPVETLDGVFLVSCTPVFNSQGHLEKIIHIAMDITDRKQIEETLHASLQEKEILLREVHHRVKNNMQVMAGLLNLQARLSGYPELTEMLNEGQRRIRAMALIHEELYDSKDFARIDLAGYVRTLSRELFQAYKINPGEIELIIQTDGAVYVDINKGIPCGLIMNELITNALKHAFSGDESGKLQIIVHETKNTEIKIVVRDNGLGLPDDVDIHQPRSVGLHLVNGLVTNQLDGQIEVIRGTGTEFRITFPLLFAGKGR